MSADFQANYMQPWTRLGSVKLQSAAASTSTLTFPAYDILTVQIFITSYAGTDVASLRFNGDSGTNYVTRFITAASATVTFTDVANTADTMIQSGAGTTKGRAVEMVITNPQSVSKVITISTQVGTGATSEGVLNVGGYGEWVNTTAQITSMQMLTKGGANMGAGSGFIVWGINL